MLNRANKSIMNAKYVVMNIYSRTEIKDAT